MKKLLTVFALTSFTAVFSQITITSNLPANINTGASIDAEVKINKGTVSNFAKYQMDVPTGYVVSAIEIKGGNFTFENLRAKIVWVSIPSDPELSIKLKIQSNSDAANPGTFSQKFYYLENNEKKEVDGGNNVITIGGGGAAVAVNTTTETKQPVETKVVETVVTETKPVETKVVETVVTETKPVETKVVETVTQTKTVETKVTETKPVETKKVETVTSTKAINNTSTTSARVNSSTASEAGMTFRVQLGAFTIEPSKNKFAAAGSVKIDLIDGMYKVTTGNFTSKEEAIKFRDQLQVKGFSGFVAKYKDGKRVN